MELVFPAAAENEAFARMVISAFLVQINPPVSLISEVRTAVSEAVTNAVVHAYRETNAGKIIMRAELDDSRLRIIIEDFGCGIENIEQAMQPFYTTQPGGERTGMGFSLMLSFMDSVKVFSAPGNGTTVEMSKLLNGMHDDIV